jgi:hypothetical protein
VEGETGPGTGPSDSWTDRMGMLPWFWSDIVKMSQVGRAAAFGRVSDAMRLRSERGKESRWQEQWQV